MSGTNPTCNLLLRIYNVRNCNGNEIIPGFIQIFCNVLATVDCGLSDWISGI